MSDCLLAVPGAPQSLHCLNRTTSQIKVAWEPPELTNGVLMCYLVTVKGHKGMRQTTRIRALRNFLPDLTYSEKIHEARLKTYTKDKK